MKSMKTYVIIWLAGLVAGLILMERWQRTSGLQGAGAGAGDPGATIDPDVGAPVPADQPRGAAVIVAGAKADAERARQLLVRMAPWASSAPTPPQLRSASRASRPQEGEDGEHPSV